MKLTTLRLENFKGLPAFEVQSGGDSFAIVGDNGTGKTTLLDAYLWLTTGKDSTGASNPDVRPRSGGPETVVSGKFDNGGGKLFLRRTMDGDGKGTFSVNGVVMKANEYWFQVPIIPEHATPWAFHQLHWTDRRAMIEKLTGFGWISTMQSKKAGADKKIKSIKAGIQESREALKVVDYLSDHCGFDDESRAIYLNATGEYREQLQYTEKVLIRKRELCERKSDRLAIAIAKATARMVKAIYLPGFDWLHEVELKKGGTAPTFEAIYHGTPFSYLNHAGKVRAGLNLIARMNELSETSYQPCWIDNAEAITKPTAPAGMQAIWLRAEPCGLRVAL